MRQAVDAFNVLILYIYAYSKVRGFCLSAYLRPHLQEFDFGAAYLSEHYMQYGDYLILPLRYYYSG